MFGYIKPFVPQLRVAEHECWRGAYCGLCKCMGRHICADSALVLSYDAAFLTLVRLAATGEEPQFKTRRCIVHPLSKRIVMEPCEALRYSSSVCALLAYHKLADDVADEGRLGKRLLIPAARRLRRKAKLRELDDEITGRLDELYNAEHRIAERRITDGSSCPSIDELAELSGSVTASIFSYKLDGGKKRVAAELGRRIGRWVYITDAADDREKDAKTGAFNPFSHIFDAESTAASLTLERRAAESALDLLGCADPGIEAILRNIITLGMAAAEKKLTVGN